MTRPLDPVRLAAGLTLAAAFVATAAAATGQIGNPLVEHVRAANNRFQDVKAALAEGYGPIPCTSGPDGGAMGIHYVNPKLLMSESADLKHPAAVLYEPAADGKLNLVAVEYVTVKGPASLEGHLFSFIGAPNRYGLPAFYELHVWAWKPNPKGVFTDMNPTVSCDHAHEMQM